jgi:asparagine N-glycosylation enzyme membrane subunit Stt3
LYKVNILSPLIFFILGLLVFFFLVSVLTKNKWIAIISSFFVSIIPTYLYRTIVGASDHDSIGMLGLFLALLFFYLFFFKIQESKVKKWESIVGGLVVGFFAMLSISCWGGSGSFIFMIFPLTFLINWIVNKKSNNAKNIIFLFLFYFWVFNVCWTFLIFGLSAYSFIYCKDFLYFYFYCFTFSVLRDVYFKIK